MGFGVYGFQGLGGESSFGVCQAGFLGSVLESLGVRFMGLGLLQRGFLRSADLGI